MMEEQTTRNVPLNIRISVCSKHIAFWFLLFAIIGFLSQGFVWHFLTPRLGIPLQIVCVFIAVFCLLIGREYRQESLIVYANFLVAVLVIFLVSTQSGIALPQMKRLWQVIVGIGLFWTASNVVSDRKRFFYLINALCFMVIINAVIGIGEYVIGSSVPWSVYAKTRYNISVALDYHPVALNYALVAPVTILGLLAADGSVFRSHHEKKFYYVAAGLGLLLLFLSGSRSGIIGVLFGSFGAIFLKNTKCKYNSLIKLSLLWGVGILGYWFLYNYSGSIGVVTEKYSKKVAVVDLEDQKATKVVKYNEKVAVVGLEDPKATKVAKYNEKVDVVNLGRARIADKGMNEAKLKKNNSRIKTIKTNVSSDPRITDNFITYLPVIFSGDLIESKCYANDVNSIAEIHKSLGLNTDINTIENAVSIKTPHNYLLTVGYVYGSIVFLSATFFYFLTIHKSITSLIYLRGQEREMARVIVGGILAFVVHSWFHNAGLYMGEMRNWLYFGLLFGLSPSRQSVD